MKPAIRNWENSPPAGGWKITIGIKGQSFTLTGSPAKIVRQISALQRRNNTFTTIADVWRFCNAEWCRRDPGRCTSGSGTNILGQRQKKPSKLLSWLNAMITLMRNGMKPVDQQIANERAKTCSECLYNRKEETCIACITTAKALTKVLIGKRSTVYDSKLLECGVCGCGLTAKVHCPIDPKDQNKYPDNCWIVKEKIKNGVSPEKE